MDTADRVIKYGVARYLDVYGEPFTLEQLAHLWCENRLGEFGVHLSSRIASDFQSIKSLRQMQMAEHLVFMFAEISNSVHRTRLYRHVRVAFPVFDNDDIARVLKHTPRVLLPFAIDALEDKDIRYLTEAFERNMFMFKKICSEAYWSDLYLLSKLFVYDMLEKFFMSQNDTLVGSLVDELRLNQNMLWPELVEKATALHDDMYFQNLQRAEAYRRDGREGMASFLSLYAEDDVPDMMREAHRRGISLDRDVVLMQSILLSGHHGRSDVYVYKLFQAIDQTVSIFLGDFES